MSRSRNSSRRARSNVHSSVTGGNGVGGQHNPTRVAPSGGIKARTGAGACRARGMEELHQRGHELPGDEKGRTESRAKVQKSLGGAGRADAPSVERTRGVPGSHARGGRTLGNVVHLWSSGENTSR